MYDIRDKIIALSLFYSVIFFHEGLLYCQGVIRIDSYQALVHEEIILRTFLEVVPVVVENAYNVRHGCFKDVNELKRKNCDAGLDPLEWVNQ